MKQLELVQVGNPKFRDPCSAYAKKEIESDSAKEAVARMKYTMAKEHGVGLAGPQVGIQKQVFVLRLLPTKYRPALRRVRSYGVFNPEIVSYSKETEKDWEGCFSVAKAGLFAEVTRPARIQVRYVDEKAYLVERTLEGLEARIFQHEYDHLHGKIFLERPTDLTSVMGVKEYRTMRENQIKD